MTGSYDAIVYDLDGTLVRLAVDWGAVAEAVTAVLEDGGVDASGVKLWSMLDLAAEAGLSEEAEATIADFEHDGARESARLDLAEGLPRPEAVGVCSLNCESACRLALETHGIADAVEVVVGRDTVPKQKPDPEPLLAAIEGLDASPERTLFVGDSETDAEAAAAAGVDFSYASSF